MPKTVKSRPAAERAAEALNGAVGRLERQFADLEERLVTTVGDLEQHLRETTAAMIHQAGAVARILDGAQASVSRPAGPVQSGKELTADGSDRPADEPATLEQVMAHCDRLEAARAVAEAGNRAKDCFLAAMSRELRTPIDGVLRMIELLGQTDLDEEQRRYLRTAGYSANGLLSLLDSLLNVSGISVESLGLHATDFDIRQLLRGVVEAIEPMALHRELKIIHRVPTELPTLVRGEARRLRQALLYLMEPLVRRARTGTELALRVSFEASTETNMKVRFAVHLDADKSAARNIVKALQETDELGPGSFSSEGGIGANVFLAGRLIELMGGSIINEPAETGLVVSFALPLDRYRQPSDDRRAHGRLPQELLQSSLGPVLDLSLGGMRVRSARPLKGELDVVLMDLEEPVTLRAVTMWTRRLGFRKHEIGLSFLKMPPEVAKQLTRISLNHRLRRILES
ncbi:MAG: histidine kinase dimerization/phospho-acceptor domain-containing protein [Planctomycetota bacterium]